MADEATWAAVAAAAAAGIGAMAVAGQAIVQRGQRHLEEAQAHQRQADAWSRLGKDWEYCVLAAVGPSEAPYWGIAAWEAHPYAEALAQLREVEVRWVDPETSDVPLSPSDIDSLVEDGKLAGERLEPYRRAVRRVLTHLSQLSSLVLRKRISVSAVYDAVGHDVIRLGAYIRPLISVSYGMGGGCVAPINMERLFWKTASLDVVSQRMGWGNFLAMSRGTVERILLLQQLLLAHAFQSGDAEAAFIEHEMRRGMTPDELCLPGRLAVCWRAARVHGRRRAIRIVFRNARIGRRSRRRRPFWRASSPSTATARTFRSALIATADLAEALVDVGRAWRMSRLVADVRQLGHPSEIQDLQSEERRRAAAQASFWSSWYDLLSDNADVPSVP